MSRTPETRSTSRCLRPGWLIVMALAGALLPATAEAKEARRAHPNVVLIYADDLGYGDLASYGARRVKTPQIDALARSGRRFTQAHATAATCTPSRYSLLTGEYAFRRKDVAILAGDAPLAIAPGRTTLPGVLRKAGYRTAVVGKWHLGLGRGSVDWNGEIAPGPLEVGFDESFIIPATGDRVPTVYVEGHRVVGLDPRDPLRVSYREPIGDEPTGKAHPDRLRVHPSHGHDQTIHDGISRIGYMAGGRSARWVDEDMADVLAKRATAFIERHRDRPFFLYFSLHDIHVPRTPHGRWKGKTECGVRCEAIAQMDFCVGQVTATLDRLGLARDTIVVFSSDNGPVVDDGYRDGAVEALGDHRPAGGLRGGKYSAFEGGTRVPFIVRWPGRVRPGVSNALVSQVDLLASLARLTAEPLGQGDAPDSFDLAQTLFGNAARGRDHLIEQAAGLSLRKGRWKLIEAKPGPAVSTSTGIETGRADRPQLYDLVRDPGERQDLASRRPAEVQALQALLERLRTEGRSRP